MISKKSSKPLQINSPLREKKSLKISSQVPVFGKEISPNSLEKNDFPSFPLEDYEITEIIGKGFQGTVFKILHKKQQKAFTAKLYSSSDPEEAILIHKEKEILAKIRHENIIQFHDFIDFNGAYLLITEYFPDAIPLSEFIKNNDFTEKQLKFILFQLLDALIFLHENQIAHRDFNIHNILIDPTNYRVKIIDFGLSRVCKQGDISSPQGHPFYRVPMELDGDNDCYFADIWAFFLVACSLFLKKNTKSHNLIKFLCQFQLKNLCDNAEKQGFLHFVELIGMELKKKQEVKQEISLRLLRTALDKIIYSD